VEITWLVAVENYRNLINLGLEIGSDGYCALPAFDESRAELPMAR